MAREIIVLLKLGCQGSIFPRSNENDEKGHCEIHRWMMDRVEICSSPRHDPWQRSWFWYSGEEEEEVGSKLRRVAWW
jgi:hypothetical protein